MSTTQSLDSLRARCDELGIAYSDRVRESGLIKLINKATKTSAGRKKKVETPEETTPVEQDNDVYRESIPTEDGPIPAGAPPIPAGAPPVPASKMQNKLEASKLIRVIVRPTDPNKRNNDGDVFSAGNEELGFFTKYVPYNNEQGWHVPSILVDLLKNSKVQLWRVVKLANGMESKEGYLTNAYNVTELPPLTTEELKTLAASQQQRGAVTA